MMLTLPSDNALFVLAVLLVFGSLGGWLAKKIHLPSVTGQILAGIILGPSVLHVFSHEAVHGLNPIIHFALGLIAVDVGTHLHIPRMRNAFKRLGSLLLLEITLTPFLVYLGLVYIGRQDWTFGMLFGALAISTAPATVLAIIKESRAKGVYVRTLIAAVALNNIACITLFEMSAAAVKVTLDPTSTSTLDVLVAPLVQLGGAALLGGAVGLALVLATKHVIQAEQVTTVSIISIFLTTGIADYLGISNLLACLFLGVTIVNLAPEKEEIGHRVFANFEPAVLAVFFTLAGLELDFGFLASGWLLVMLFVLTRGIGKIWSGVIAMRLAGGTRNVRRYLGMGLIPQAGVAVGLLLQMREKEVFEPISSLLLAIGVASVAINEVIGPITTKIGLARTGEIGKDRPRLIDFIHEENIVTDFQARTKEEAVSKLVDRMITTHGLTVNRQEFIDDILERETLMSSCIGRGLAVPHGNLPEGEKLVGVMGISRQGMPFGTPDGLPLRCLVLLAAPPDQRDRHQEVQAVLARNIGANWSLQLQLYHAKSPAHVYEILHAEEAEDFNYFLEGDGEESGT
jgi:PTS system fructose-specific IIC component